MLFNLAIVRSTQKETAVEKAHYQVSFRTVQMAIPTVSENFESLPATEPEPQPRTLESENPTDSETKEPPSTAPTISLTTENVKKDQSPSSSSNAPQRFAFESEYETVVQHFKKNYAPTFFESII